ncbi:hypothetical protein JKF63_07552 [Porcisia hertigi]|uniref:Uncharacterized protein n=1 Tax=Porcisia hertigi TaxID=2761500 RepID=A0A836YJF1_9TRYP|nr:hypothetical protein JKF63_07552 [Porcisia hertigi]
MPAPSSAAVRVPFYYTARVGNEEVQALVNASDTHDEPVFVTNVFIEVIAFGTRFFWVHISESLASQSIPRLGSCCVAVGLQLAGDGGRVSISSSQLMELEAAQRQDTASAPNSSVQSAFATSLAQRLVRGVEKRFGTQASVYVNCAIEGMRCLALLGTEGGSGFDMTFQFGALVYRESFKLLAQQWEP